MHARANYDVVAILNFLTRVAVQRANKIATYAGRQRNLSAALTA